MNSDQFIVLFAPAVLGRINNSNFGIVFRQSFDNCSILKYTTGHTKATQLVAKERVVPQFYLCFGALVSQALLKNKSFTLLR